jgi:secreted trypsin-like serine protease
MATPFKLTKRIAGGNRASFNDYPFAAFIKYKNGYRCTASIIGERWILTAAHCVLSRDPSISATDIVPSKPEDTTVVLGEDSSNAQVASVKNLYIHPDYNRETRANDISLVKLEKPIEFSTAIQPINILNKDPTFLTKQVVYFIGGGVDETLTLTRALKVVDFRLGSNEYCASRNPAVAPNIDQFLCNISIYGRDVCKGDSGGPLFIKSNNGGGAAGPYVQIGVSSHFWNLENKEPKCNSIGNTEYYMRASYYIPWISSTTGMSKDSFTVKS